MHKDIFIVRWLKAETNFKQGLIIFLDESCIELSLSAFICVVRISEENFAYFSAGFSTIMALLVAPVILFIPFYLIRAKRKY